MQKFSDEELVDIIDSFGFDKDTYVRLKARLERGRKAIEAMEKLVAIWNKFYADDSYLNETEKVIKDYQQSQDGADGN